ncbi:hypothetical protein STENM327S_05828 [Streptomyces tendae]
MVVGCTLAKGAPVDTLALPALHHDEDLTAYDTCAACSAAR